MSRRCVNLNGKIYPSNGIFDGKQNLYSTQGEQVYQSSIKCDVTVQLCGSLNCKGYLVATEEDFDARLQSVPKFQIGATLNDKEDEPKLRMKNMLSFSVPVDSQIEAIQCAKKFSSISNKFREAVNKDDKCLIKHPNTGSILSLDQITDLKRKVSSYNQKVRQGAEGQLIQAGLRKGNADYSMEYGKIMGANRLQLSKYSLRIVIRIRHNIYREFSVPNFTDSVENVAYHVAKSKYYSEDREHPINIPVTSYEQYQALMGKLNDLINDTKALEELVRVNDSEVIFLGTSEERTKEQIEMDAQLSESMSNIVMENNDEDDETDNAIYDILNSVNLSSDLTAGDGSTSIRKSRSRGKSTSTNDGDVTLKR